MNLFKGTAIALCATGAMVAFVATARAADPPTVACQKAIDKATKNHYAAVYGAYDGCLATVYKNKPCSAVKTVAAISGAGNSLRKTITASCGQTQLNALFGTGVLNTDCVDSSENPGKMSARELSQCIARTNLLNVGTALLDAFPCVATPITLGAGSGSVIQAGTSTIPVTLSGSYSACYHTLNADGTTGTAGRHIFFNKNSSLDPVEIIPGLLTVCVRNAFSPGQVSCQADTSNKNGPMYYTMQDHVLNLDGSGLPTANNVWTSGNKVCSAGAPSFTGSNVPADISAADCTSAILFPPSGAKVVKPALAAGNQTLAKCSFCLEGEADGTSVGGNLTAGDGKNLTYVGYLGTAKNPNFNVGAGCNNNLFTGSANDAGNGDNVCDGAASLSESGLTCQGGSLPPGTACKKDWQCWGTQADADAGVKCKTQSGNVAGEISVLNVISFDQKNPGNNECGADGTCCNTDDNALGVPGTPTVAPSTSGVAEAAVFDVDPSSANVGQKITKFDTCGPDPCETSTSGAPANCATLLAGSASGLATAGSFPTLDGSNYGDAVITFRLE